MPNYRRLYIPGSTVFLTWITYQRNPLFANLQNITLLRQAVSQTKHEFPFKITAAVILPDHIHFVWTLPATDSNYSKRVGRIKALFTKAFQTQNHPIASLTPSRLKHRERNIWHRRFWEHTIRSEQDLACCLDYVHYNPVKHGLVKCPVHWPYSSFCKWVSDGYYAFDWGCCDGAVGSAHPTFGDLFDAGE